MESTQQNRKGVDRGIQTALCLSLFCTITCSHTARQPIRSLKHLISQKNIRSKTNKKLAAPPFPGFLFICLILAAIQAAPSQSSHITRGGHESPRPCVAARRLCSWILLKCNRRWNRIRHLQFRQRDGESERSLFTLRKGEMEGGKFEIYT